MRAAVASDGGDRHGPGVNGADGVAAGGAAGGVGAASLRHGHFAPPASAIDSARFRPATATAAPTSTPSTAVPLPRPHARQRSLRRAGVT
jgi:hypothetical protein